MNKLIFNAMSSQKVYGKLAPSQKGKTNAKKKKKIERNPKNRLETKKKKEKKRKPSQQSCRCAQPPCVYALTGMITYAR